MTEMATALAEGVDNEAAAAAEADDENAVDTEAAEGDAPDPNADDPEGDGEDQGEEEGDDEGEGDDAETLVFDFGGNKLEVPKDSIPEEVAEQLDKFTKGTWSDYTKKSQEIADRSKRLEAAETAVQKISGLTNETLDAYSRGLQVAREIDELSNVDVNALWQSNPDQARRVSDVLAQKQAEYQKIVAEVGSKEQAQTQAQQEETARRQAEGAEHIERKVKGFKETHLPAVLDYAVNTLGMSRETAENDWALNPEITLCVHKARLYDEMQAKARKATPKPAQATPGRKTPSKGGKKTGASYDLVKDADKMSEEEWVRRRHQQLGKKANA